MNVDFNAARQRINERLDQELTRIRNLPKKSKIKICNKHGLKLAHHMNTGLLKSLEVDLAIIKREERRVNNELTKKRKVFTDNTQRSFPRLLPIPGQEKDERDDHEKKREFPNHHSPKRFHTSWSQPDVPDYFSRIASLENKKRKAFLMAITEQSKQTTKQIIEQNIKRMDQTSPKTEAETSESLVTRLNRRYEKKRSCFPSLLGAEGTWHTSNLGSIPEKKRQQPKADAYYKGITFFMPETQTNQSVEKQSSVAKKIMEGKTNERLGKGNLVSSKRLRQDELNINFLPKIEISEAETSKKKLKQIIERKVVGNEVSQRLGQNSLKLKQTVLQVKKKMNSETKLGGTMKMRNENAVFTKHWS